MIHFDDGDVEDNVEWGRIEPMQEDSAEVQEYFDHLEELKANNAIFINADGSVTKAVGASKISSAASDADGALVMVINGAVSDRILDIASEASIETVVGTKEGKGFKEL